MKKLFSIGVFFFLFLPACIAMSAGSPPQPGGQLPEMRITATTEQADNSYLGISGGKSSFRITEIKGKVVILEILSMYCPFCQREAPTVNELYEVIEKDPKLSGKVKVVGIGVGNTAFEVDLFRNKYGVRFPVYSDPDYLIHKQLGEVRTPYFIAVRIDENGSHQVIYSNLGGFGEVNSFLDSIRKASGLQ